MKPRFADVQDRLRFVRFQPGQDLDLRFFPDFLIVGPQRTGTTWLHENLIEHPQVFMPAQKEIYYFNNLRTAKWHPADQPPVQPDLDWYLRFFQPDEQHLARRDRECRRAWGEPYEIAVRGEGTATYSVAMDPEVIAELLVLNPDIKIMTMIRNPIDRAWSHAKKDLAKHRNRRAEDVPEREWIEFVEARYQIDCGHHSRQWEKWNALLKPGHYFTGRFDDIVADPEALLLRAFGFLGIRADAKYVGARAKQRINPTEGASMPPNVRAVLERIYRDEIGVLRAQGMIS